MNASCPNTGITQPECSCRACLVAQLERHMPSLLQARAAKSARAATERDLTRPAEQQRRAA